MGGDEWICQKVVASNSDLVWLKRYVEDFTQEEILTKLCITAFYSRPHSPKRIEVVPSIPARKAES